MATYQIYELSARAVMSYAMEQDGVYTFTLNRSATEHCKVPSANHEQDSCAMFHQMMYQLHGKGWRERSDEKVTALSDVLFYMDFAGIFDRRGTGRTQQARREKARDMFRPEGITLDFGSGPHRYVAFERSASMSRQSRLSFIRADLYEPMRQRIMLNMELSRCQLSKLYAYNGLMFSSGTRVDGIRIDKKHRVIVIDNPTKRVERAPVITLREGRETGTFYRADILEDLDITCFDGVGLISKEYAQVVDKACCGSHTHTSFQIRMPYIKGMLHQVDFKDFLKRSGSRRAGDRLAQRLAWGLGGVAVVTAVVALARGKGVLVAAGALAGTLCMGAPLCATLIAGMTGWMQQRAASRVGAVVPGWSSMEELGKVNTIVTEGHDLFPTGCVTLHGLKTFEKERIDLAILYAASVLIAGCDTLRDLFLEIIQNRTEILYKVESLTCEQGRGFTAWVDGHRIVIGGRAMMTAHQVGIPSRDWEERYTHGRLQPVYLAVSGKLFGMFVVGYQGSREIAASLHTLQKSGLSLLVRTDDFSLTGDLIEQAYRLRPGSVKVLTENETNQLATATGYLPESEGCMVHLGSLASYVGGLHAAACAVSAEKSANLVMAVSVAVSALVALVLSFSGGLASLALPAAVLYQLAWAVPALALPLTRSY